MRAFKDLGIALAKPRSEPVYRAEPAPSSEPRRTSRTIAAQSAALEACWMNRAPRSDSAPTTSRSTVERIPLASA